MLCERCNANKATVHLTQVIDGNVEKLHLCEGCAKESGIELHDSVSITDVLAGLGKVEKKGPEPAVEHVCKTCGLKLQDFKKRGRLGCPACYETFTAELKPLLKAVHQRRERHIGKTPRRIKMGRVSAERLESLKQSLQAAIKSELFEEAARLRDEIHACMEHGSSVGEQDE